MIPPLSNDATPPIHDAMPPVVIEYEYITEPVTIIVVEMNYDEDKCKKALPPGYENIEVNEFHKRTVK